MLYINYIILQIASGKIGIHFPRNNVYLFRAENVSKDTLIKDILPVSKEYDKSLKESNQVNYHIGAIVGFQIEFLHRLLKVILRLYLYFYIFSYFFFRILYMHTCY